MKPKWKPHDDPQCACAGCNAVTRDTTSGKYIPQNAEAWRTVSEAAGIKPEFDDASVRRVMDVLGPAKMLTMGSESSAPVGFTKDGDPSIGGESRMCLVSTDDLDFNPERELYFSIAEHERLRERFAEALTPVMLGYSHGTMSSFTWRDEHGEHSLRREPGEEDDDWTRRCFKAMGEDVKW